jgi:hypothetical protein
VLLLLQTNGGRLEGESKMDYRSRDLQKLIYDAYWRNERRRLLRKVVGLAGVLSVVCNAIRVKKARRERRYLMGIHYVPCPLCGNIQICGDYIDLSICPDCVFAKKKKEGVLREIELEDEKDE